MVQTSHHMKGPSCFTMAYIKALGSWHTMVSIFCYHKGSLGGGLGGGWGGGMFKFDTICVGI
jgi:hypothetical protein